MALHNVELMRMVRGQIARRTIDYSMLNITVMGSVVHLTGVLRPLGGHRNVDLKEEMNMITQILRQKSGISEVVWDVTLRV